MQDILLILSPRLEQAKTTDASLSVVIATILSFISNFNNSLLINSEILLAYDV